jgi:hypothetical protein
MATGPIDFRKRHDRLTAMVKTERRKDPFTRSPASAKIAILAI